MATTDFRKVLSDARQLPKASQLKLVTALLNGEGEALPLNGNAAQPFIGLNEAELRALAEAVLAPARAQRLRQLLRQHRAKKLTRAARVELDELLEESDQLAVMKAKAAYTLKLQHA
jgi:hypothetical protein